MAVTPAQLKSKLTEFAASSDDDVQAAIDEAERRTNRTTWGARADDSVTYLAGHILKTIAELASGGDAGAVQSMTVGPISKTFAVPSVAMSELLGRTAYGRMYLEMRSAIFVPRVI